MASPLVIFLFSSNSFKVSQTYGWRMAFFIGLAPVALVLYVRRHAPESEEWAQAKAAGKVNKVPLTDLFTKNNYQSP